MTSEERNRRLKYGHEVPRSWIPEFHANHKKSTQRSISERSRPTKTSETKIRDHYELKRRSRLLEKRSQINRLNKDIRFVQISIAVLFIIIGILAGGLIGFFLGTCICLEVLAIPLKFKVHPGDTSIKIAQASIPNALR
jgi:hypothetical protein